jgi:hypothetical protein
MGKVAHKKKLLALLLAVVLLVMTGCTDKVKETEELIDAIGEVVDDFGYDGFKPLEKEVAINKAYSAYNELSDGEKEKVTNAETLIQDNKQLTQATEMKKQVQTFAEKLFAACATRLKKSETINVTGAWCHYQKITAEMWYFTFEFSITNSFGNTETVYYGGSTMELSDEKISSTANCLTFVGTSALFMEGSTSAMDSSAGIALDADAIQTYFRKHR